MLKNEYLAEYFFGFMQSGEWDWGIFIWKILGFLIPAALAYAYVWWLPKWVLNPCYKKEMEYKVDRRIIKNKAEKRLTDSETKKVESKIELLQKQDEAKNINPEEEWRIDFEKCLDYENESLLDTLESLKEAVYERSGRIKEEYSDVGMTSDELLFCDTHGLIALGGASNGVGAGRISLTDKGKLFLREGSKYIIGRKSRERF